MDLRAIPLLLVLVSVCVLGSKNVEKQTHGCSTEGIDLGVCLDRKNGSFSINGNCCKVLNKVVKTGFNCLCLLLASSFPLFTTPVSLPLSDCFITIPPLTLCKVLAPMPIALPPNTPSEVKQPLLPPLRPPEIGQIPANSTQNNFSTNMGTQSSSSNTTNTSSLSHPRELQKPNSTQPTCLSYYKNEASRGIGNNRLQFLSFLFLFVFFSL